MRFPTLLFALILVGTFGMNPCLAQDKTTTPEAAPTESSPEKPAAKRTGLANPASVNCAKKGGKLEIRKGKKGEYGVCKFPNGKECEEWALFRGKCSADSDKAEAPATPDQK